MILNESLEHDVIDRDKLVTIFQSAVETVQHDLDWLLHMGVFQIMDKLIEHPEFTTAVSLIRHATFVVGEESGRGNLASETSSGPSGGDSQLNPALSVNEAFLAFSSMDHASLLGLGDLDIQGI